MTYSEVTIELTPSRKFAINGKSIVFSAVGLPDITLPCSVTTYAHHDTPEGMVATSITLPRGIAERERLIELRSEETNEPETMSRHDWFTLGAIVGLLSEGHTEHSQIVWDARKIADKATKQ
jgi:hypothetical protein